MRYGIEIRVGKEWRALGPMNSVYEFATRLEAETVARILYPEQCREALEGATEPAIRVVEKEAS